MAADHFTQVRNQLFRDPRLSAKAKGIFGFISTHRDGYGVTPESIARYMRDGVTAVRTALRELEQCGYLHRSQHRDPVTRQWLSATYLITDEPERTDLATLAAEPGSHRPEPSVDSPPTGPATTADHTPKNTTNNNTIPENTIRPSVPMDASARASDEPAATDGRNGTRQPAADHPQQPARRPRDPASRTPGEELLRHIGVQHPAYRLTGRALVDQGQAVTRMLAVGWTPAQVRDVVSARPLPEHITTSVGAIVAHRLREAEAARPPHTRTSSAAWDSLGGPLIGDPTGGRLGPASGDSDSLALWDHPNPAHHQGTPTPPPYGHHLAVVHVECEGQDGACGLPARPGYDRCTSCLGLPVCACGVGRHDPARGETQCDACRQAHTTLAAVLSSPHKRPAAGESRTTTPKGCGP